MRSRSPLRSAPICPICRSFRPAERTPKWLVAQPLSSPGWPSICNRQDGGSPIPRAGNHRLAISTLRADLDTLEEHAQGYEGTVKLSVSGPWTLAAMMERPRGDRVLADPGARRDISQSLAEGIAQLVAELVRRLPDVDPLIQLDEPMLPAVLAGSIPNAKRPVATSRHRAERGQRRHQPRCSSAHADTCCGALLRGRAVSTCSAPPESPACFSTSTS